MRAKWEPVLFYALLTLLILMFLAIVKFATMLRPF